MATITGGGFGHVSGEGVNVSDHPGSVGGSPLTLGNIAPSTLTGGSGPSVGASFDTVVSPAQAGTSVTGGGDTTQPQAPDGGSTVLHLPDGSTVIILGSTNPDTSFSH